MISVIIPVFNRSGLLPRAIKSALKQAQLELIVVDDGSTEDQSASAELLENAGHKFVYQERKGVAAARNHGVALSTGDYLAFLDSDDEWMSGKLEKQLSFHQQNPQYRISQCLETWYRKGRRVNPKLKHKQPEGEAFEASLELCCISPSAVFLERQLFDEVGGFDESLPVCEDYDLWLRITATEEVGLLEEALVNRYGGHEDQLSCSKAAMDRFRVYAISKLLSEAKLDSKKKQLAERALVQKLRVLEQGARKRGRGDIANLFQSNSLPIDVMLDDGKFL